MQTVLITGASSGIGKAYAYGFAKRGYNLIITARREDLLNEIARDLTQKHKVEFAVIALDLSAAFSAKALVDEIDKRRLTVDILINNAGFATKGALADTDFNSQHDEINVNIATLTELTYLLIGRMAQRKSGTVINVGSASGFNPVPYSAVYSASKAYVLSFTQSIDYEYRDKGVNAIVVCPQATNTHFFDNFAKMSGKLREPEDVVNSTFMAMKKKQVICTDGTLCKLQNVMSHILSRRFCVKITGGTGKKLWENKK